MHSHSLLAAGASLPGRLPPHRHLQHPPGRPRDRPGRRILGRPVPAPRGRGKDIAASAPPGAVTIIGMQEVLHDQLLDIKAGLGPSWAHVGVARDDGFESGENDVAVRDVRPALKGWDAAYTRISTIAVFEHKETGVRWIAANTHLDNEGPVARAQGVKFITSRIRHLQSIWGPLGVSLTGDFNCPPGGEAYETLAADGFFEELSKRAARKRALWNADKYSVFDNIVNGVYASDHRAVVGDIRVSV
ncbi:unnamed protein product [Parascedosporium putredinis]|uniref:Endonuclease/exonuclease/phosphatase domain-containing protein n=1 Tax=Parascedosporium putredinis TaxID=1442378 RepID=A0A9P1HBG7_9PEZI|nr:unnamed protein product [Parascedosporium putredinis]CAI8003939.1 unnamed protein product [Parascedosporium putredinis]